MKDILFDNGDVIIQNGDFLVDESSQQEGENILLANPGQILLNPLLGVGIGNYLKSTSSLKMLKSIRENMKIDNLNVTDLNYSNGILTLNVNRLK